METVEVPIRQLVRNNYREHDLQTVEERARNIAAVGLLQPPRGFLREDGTVELLDGHGRVESCALLGWESVPVIIGDAPDNELARLVAQMGANLQALASNPVEDGEGFVKALALGATIEELSEKIGKGRRWIEDRITAAAAGEMVRDALRRGAIGIRLAVSLAQLDENRQRIALNLALRSDITESEIRAKVDQLAEDQGAESQEGFGFIIEEWHAEKVAEKQSPKPAPSLPLGRAEIAELLGVKVGTVSQWITRGIFPEPMARISGTPVWDRDTIELWHEGRG